MPRLTAPRAVVAFAAAALALALSACSATDARSTGGETAGGDAFAGTVPTFDGPWAAEFAEAYRSTTDASAHAILAKGSITDADYSQIGDAFITCMAAHDFRVRVTGSAGEFAVDESIDGNDPRLTKAIHACSSGFDAVAGLRGRMLRNPQNLDEDTILVQCFIKAGIADKGYTAKEFARQREDDQLPFDLDSAKAHDCLVDPLGLASSGG